MSTTTTVSFRITQEQADRLRQAARKQGLTPGELSRALVIESLDAQEFSAADVDLSPLHDQLLALREDVAVATEAILTATGADGEKAREFVNRTLRGHP